MSISFATPDAQFPPSSVQLPAIDLFLYEIVENKDLRSHDPDLERMPDGRVVKTPAPARVDCHYDVPLRSVTPSTTAWPSSGARSRKWLM